MTKEELKDKYSAFIAEISEIMGLGKPIDILKLCATTDLFFRPLENRITDLEKENEELKEKLKHRNCLDCSNHSSKLRMRTLELEKENAELKRLKRECETSLCRAEYQYNYEQLTKAKEIIKELVRVEYADFTNGDYSNELSKVLEQAEQFLSEVEK